MSATAEGIPPLWLPDGGDLDIWYRTFEVYAASAPLDNTHFHGPHISVPVPLARVAQGLREQSRADLETLPTLDEMRAALESRRRPPSDMAPLHSGSPCHNLWHWIHD